MAPSWRHSRFAHGSHDHSLAELWFMGVIKFNIYSTYTHIIDWGWLCGKKCAVLHVPARSHRDREQTGLLALITHLQRDYYSIYLKKLYFFVGIASYFTISYRLNTLLHHIRGAYIDRIKLNVVRLDTKFRPSYDIFTIFLRIYLLWPYVKKQSTELNCKHFDSHILYYIALSRSSIWETNMFWIRVLTIQNQISYSNLDQPQQLLLQMTISLLSHHGASGRHQEVSGSCSP